MRLISAWSRTDRPIHGQSIGDQRVIIYLARHGQTDWNAEERLQGQKDIPLNDTGKAQAKGNGRRLFSLIGRGDDFAFVASPLTRTRQTMEHMLEALGRQPGQYETDDRLVEISFGDWEGRTLAEVFREDPDGIAERDADKWNFIPPGDNAESYEILSWRVGSWLRALERNTVCVCHGGVIRCLFVLTGQAGNLEAAHLDIPQDRLLRLENGKLEWI